LISLLSNRSLVLLKAKRFTETVEDCDRAMAIAEFEADVDKRRDMSKVLYRRGQALGQLGLFDRADADLAACLAIDPK
jgi:hypothetical protein